MRLIGMMLIVIGVAGCAADSETPAPEPLEVPGSQTELGCWAPDDQTVHLDCDAVCEAVVSCDAEEAHVEKAVSSCVGVCQISGRYLTPGAGPKIEQCILELGCDYDGGGAAWEQCSAILLEEGTIQASSFGLATCDAVTAAASDCGYEAADLSGTCGHMAATFSVASMNVVSAGVEGDCADLGARLAESNCMLLGYKGKLSQ